MLAMPLVLGAVRIGLRPAAGWWVPPAVVLTFLAHYALVPVVQRWREGKPAPPGWATPRVVWGCGYLLGAAACFAAAWT